MMHGLVRLLVCGYGSLIRTPTGHHETELEAKGDLGRVVETFMRHEESIDDLCQSQCVLVLLVAQIGLQFSDSRTCSGSDEVLRLVTLGEVSKQDAHKSANGRLVRLCDDSCLSSREVIQNLALYDFEVLRTVASVVDMSETCTQQQNNADLEQELGENLSHIRRDAATRPGPQVVLESRDESEARAPGLCDVEARILGHLLVDYLQLQLADELDALRHVELGEGGGNETGCFDHFLRGARAEDAVNDQAVQLFDC
ncbi:hypothetical protein RRF57_011248 [Xylaria bambusicola]|uniref:Uncharacterized protein n=1 Tax=Xylaria bambusicola TaxID=326684 RepID=A0AAN7UYA1_9PEZI